MSSCAIPISHPLPTLPAQGVHGQGSPEKPNHKFQAFFSLHTPKSSSQKKPLQAEGGILGFLKKFVHFTTSCPLRSSSLVYPKLLWNPPSSGIPVSSREQSQAVAVGGVRMGQAGGSAPHPPCWSSLKLMEPDWSLSYCWKRLLHCWMKRSRAEKP